MSRESKADKKKRVKKIMTRLRKLYPDVKCTLDFSTPLELLIATILAAQCTDVRVNKVTKRLFKKYKSPTDYANADQKELQEDIRSCGFYRNKSKSIRGCCKDIAEKYGGSVPDTMEELVALSGVGRKTANVVLGVAFGTPGIVVDTHFRRVSQRLGLTRNNDPDKIELDLMELVPKKDWTEFSHLFVFHGRNICASRKPDQDNCPLSDLCPYEP